MENKILRGIVNNLIISNVFFSPFSDCTSAVSLFLASLWSSIYGAAFEGMITSLCLCTIITQCTITLSLYRCSCTHLLQFKLVSFCYEPHIFTFLYKKGCCSTKDNQVSRSEVILLSDLMSSSLISLLVKVRY